MPRLTPLEMIKHFDELPDDQIIPDPVARIILNDSDRSFRRNRPVPRVDIGPGRGGSRVGDVRARARGKSPTP